MKDFLKKKAIQVRVTEKQHEIITRNAFSMGMHVSEYLRNIILKFIKGDNNNGKQ